MHVLLATRSRCKADKSLSHNQVDSIPPTIDRRGKCVFEISSEGWFVAHIQYAYVYRILSDDQGGYTYLYSVYPVWEGWITQ